MVNIVNSLEALSTTIGTCIHYKLEGHIELELDFPFKVIDFSYEDRNRNVSWLFGNGARAISLIEKIEDPVFDYKFYFHLSHPNDECYMLTTPVDRISAPRIY